MLAGEPGRLKIRGKSLLAIGLILTACAQPEETLDGVRLDVRTPVGSQTAAAPQGNVGLTSTRLSAPRTATSWTHRNGTSEHNLGHVALGGALAQIWSTDIGDGEDRRTRITADPVSDGARIFVMDASSRVSAVNTAGKTVWSYNLTPRSEKAGLVSGGSLTVAAGTLYATSAYGTLTAFEATTGAIRWQQKLAAVPSGAPAVRGDVVYFITRDNRAWALETATGRIRWQISGIQSTTGFAGGAGPAVNNRVAVFPFSSGELIAVLRQGGVRLWSGSVSGRRIGRVYAAVGDFASDPVIQGSTVFAGTQSGRLVSVDLNTGQRNWTTQIGALGPMWADAGSLWLISDEGDLVRVRTSDGQVIWTQDVPYFTTPKVKRRRGIHAHYGPILAGGRLLIASSDGALRAFNPATGAALGSVNLPGGATTAPIVVGNTLYVVTSDGHLRAFR